MRLRTLGNCLMAFALVTYCLEQSSSNAVSVMLGRGYCGDQYLSVGGFPITEQVCGFEMDLYLAVFLLAVFISGIFMRLVARFRGEADSALNL